MAQLRNYWKTSKFQRPTKVAELIMKDEDRWDKQILCRVFDEQIMSEILTELLKIQTTQDN